MNQEFNAAESVYVDRDQRGTVRQVLHFDAPFESRAFTPQLAGAEYLERFADLLGLEPGQLTNLGLPPETRVTDAPVEYRFLAEKRQDDMVTVAYQQTALGLPVWEAGIAVQMQVEPFRVLSAQSTQHPEVEVKRPSASAVKRAESLDEDELARRLGIHGQLADGKGGVRKSLAIELRQLVVYRFERANITRDRPPAREQEHPGFAPEQPRAETGPSGPTLPLPDVPDKLEEGRHYVCVKIDFELQFSPWGRLHWAAILEVGTLAVVYLRPFVDDVAGLVFDIDR
jgi:hypothetical protein